VVELLPTVLLIVHTTHVELEGALVSLNSHSHRLPAVRKSAAAVRMMIDKARVTLSWKGALVSLKSNSHRLPAVEISSSSSNEECGMRIFMVDEGALVSLNSHSHGLPAEQNQDSSFGTR
jgi:hypothetical protein